MANKTKHHKQLADNLFNVSAAPVTRQQVEDIDRGPSQLLQKLAGWTPRFFDLRGNTWTYQFGLMYGNGFTLRHADSFTKTRRL